MTVLLCKVFATLPWGRIVLCAALRSCGHVTYHVPPRPVELMSGGYGTYLGNEAARANSWPPSFLCLRQEPSLPSSGAAPSARSPEEQRCSQVGMHTEPEGHTLSAAAWGRSSVTAIPPRPFWLRQGAHDVWEVHRHRVDG